LLATASMAQAGWTTFSADGKLVYSIASATSVEVIDIAAGKTTTRQLALPEGSPEIADLATARDGQVWILTKDRLWLWNPVAEALALSETAPKGVFFHEAACHVASGRMVITGIENQPDAAGYTGRVFYKRNSDDPAMHVFVRRLDGIRG